MTDDLRADEREYLFAEGRCGACGHLNVLQDGDLGYCRIPGCRCKDGRVDPKHIVGDVESALRKVMGG